MKSGVEAKRKRRRRRAKANKLVTVMNKSSVTVNPELAKPSLTEAACTPFTPNNAQPDVSTSLLNNSSGKNSPSSTYSVAYLAWSSGS